MIYVENSQCIGVLNKIKRNLPINVWKLFYNALIKPIMLYGSCVWRLTSCENMRLQAAKACFTCYTKYW